MFVDIALLADHDELRLPWLASPGTVELMSHPLADRLQQEPHRLSRDGKIALGAQNVLLARQALDGGDQRLDVADLRQVDNNGREIVVLMFVLASRWRGRT